MRKMKLFYNFQDNLPGRSVNVAVLFAIVVTIVATFALIAPQSVSAHSGTSRGRQPQNSVENDFQSRCASASWASRVGFIWFNTTSTGYFDLPNQFNVDYNQTDINNFFVRGSVFSCHNTIASSVYAHHVQVRGAEAQSRLTLDTNHSSGTTYFYRGTTDGTTHKWTGDTNGNGLGGVGGDLNIRGLATNNQSGSDRENLTIGLYRCFSNHHPNSGLVPSSGAHCGTEWITITIIREAEPSTQWDYRTNFSTNPSTTHISNHPSYVYRNAGTTISLASRTSNVGDGRGASYRHQFIKKVGGNNWSNVRNRNGEGGLNPGAGRTRGASYTIPGNIAHGTRICFRARIRPFRGQATPSLTVTSSGWRNSPTRCLRVNNPEWNYTINWAAGKSPADQDSPTYPKPGDPIRIGSTVRNTGNGRGADYHHWLEPNGIGTKRRVNNQGHKGRKQGVNSPYNGLGASGSRTLQTFGSPLYTVTSSPGSNRVVPHHNENLCFTSFVTNVHGWTIGRRVTNSGPREVSGEKCMRVYNKRFNFDQPTVSDTPSSFIISSGGTTINGIDAQALNDSCQGSDQGGALCDSSAPYGIRNNSSPGEARNAQLVIFAQRMSTGQVYTVQSKSQAQVNHTSAITIDNASFTAPADTQAGEEFCFFARITPERGYSDGQGSTGSRQSTQACSTASIATTTHTHQGSIWSGTIFGLPFDINDPALQNNYPLSCDPSVTPSSGIIRGLRNSNAASWAHHGIVALDALSTFFTQGTLRTNELLLANDGTSGNSGLTACVPNLPDALALDENRSVGAGYTITNGDLTSADGKIIGFDAGGGDLTFNLSSGTPFNKRTTVVVYNVDNVFVASNVSYGNSNNPSYTGANAVSKIPALALVADGNIRISENVTQLDGLYYATGTLDTCAEHKNLSTDPNVCGQQLIVNGALVSDNLALKRTHGTDAFADGNDNEPAELINMTGEMYIAPPPLRLKNGIRGGGIEIQDVIDLPPLF